jgi:hypothetical protein
MTNVAAAVVYLLVFMFKPGEVPDPSTLETYTYESMEECEESSKVLREMLVSNEEFVKRATEAGYAGVMTLCTDDPTAGEL